MAASGTYSLSQSEVEAGKNATAPDRLQPKNITQTPRLLAETCPHSSKSANRLTPHSCLGVFQRQTSAGLATPNCFAFKQHGLQYAWRKPSENVRPNYKKSMVAVCSLEVELKKNLFLLPATSTIHSKPTSLSANNSRLRHKQRGTQQPKLASLLTTTRPQWRCSNLLKCSILNKGFASPSLLSAQTNIKCKKIRRAHKSEDS